MTRRILIIDDDAAVRDFLRDYFEDRDYDVLTAEDGAAGLKLFERESFDLVLCDLLMPVMLGTQALARIKQLKADQKVIMLSGVREESLLAKARTLGCHLYLNKPVRLDELETRVSECFAG